ncbi:transcription cofactor vestigial-like protein 1 [Takifugu flavidus]|uniref:transcription cofactor vestigial-like protein 1 n=1 Tax=Takifugu flavidus TaxID=433684 RepID=UPI002544D05C|nr:transcription cofactor vestigial-like protein 1 [Takifugu flavidus]XP_056898478.1 transcription cofactor vestigial-like protein 1 [Takifugu flavidus]
MEDRTEGPMAVKVEKHSQYIILTYFHGDTNSMVDAHFSRALRDVCRDKGPGGKAKKTRKTVKLEKSNLCQESTVVNNPKPQLPPGSLLPLSPVEDSPNSWHPFTARGGESVGLPSLAYSLSPEELSLTGQQYATSLLNLLHTEQVDMGASLPSSSKPELHPSWMVPPGLREPVDHTMAFKPGRCLDKKDLYWY